MNDRKDEISINCILVYPQIRQKAIITYLHSKDNFGMPPDFVDSVYISMNKTQFKNIPNDSLKNNRFCLESNTLSLDRCYNYYLDSLQLKPVERYSCNAQYKDVEISGETIIPGNFNVFIDGRKINWTKSDNAYLFRIQIIKDNNDFIFQKTTKKYSINLDSKQFSPGNYQIKIEAIDKNFYDFTTQQLERSGLSVGYGVFGSVTIVKKDFYIQ